MSTTNKFHYYSDLSFNIWPLIVSLNLISLFLRLSLRFHKFVNFNVILFFINLFLIILSVLNWFKEFNSEFNLVGSDNFSMDNLLKSFFLLFILSEIMVFFSIFWTFYFFYFYNNMEIGLIWPPFNIKMFDFTKIPFINTFILLISRVTLTIRHNNLTVGEFKKVNSFIFYTITLGLVFRYMQMNEYNDSYFCIRDSNFSSIFFLLTGLHGIHVILGSLILLAVLAKCIKINRIVNSFSSFEIGAWYWHFVDLVWLFVFYSLYYLNF